MPHSALMTSAHTYVNLLVNCRTRIRSPPSLAPSVMLSSTGSYLVGRLWGPVLQVATPCKSTGQLLEQRSSHPLIPTNLATVPSPPRLGILWVLLEATIPSFLLSHLTLASSYLSKVTNGFFATDAALLVFFPTMILLFHTFSFGSFSKCLRPGRKLD